MKTSPRLIVQLVPIYGNHIMFAHDLRHNQIEYFSLRLVGVVRLRLGERYHKSSIFNRQYSIPGLSLLGFAGTCGCRKSATTSRAGGMRLIFKKQYFDHLFYLPSFRF